MNLKDVEIDYTLLGLAANFYKKAGYENVETPWIVDYREIVSTAPNNLPGYAVEVIPPCGDNPSKEFLVCSAEQGFVYMLNRYLLSPEQLYYSVSPCFRYEDDTEIHSKEFMKLELFSYSTIYSNAIDLMNIHIANALTFIKGHVDKNVSTLENSDAGIDIISYNGIELGSYGVRRIGDFYIAYGTGIALPRASLVFSQTKKGYHNTIIPRGKLNTSSKILEEVYELIDSEQQGNKIMALCELSDIIAAIKMYVEVNHSDITLNDLIKMAEVTDDAFKSGRRS